MADTYTKIADLIDPEVMGDMVSAAIPSRCPPMPTSAMPTLWPRARL